MLTRRPVTVEGSEIVLRQPAASDRAAFLAAMTSSAELHHPWLYPPVTDGAFAAYLRRNGDDRYASFIARRRSDGAIVGMLNISEIVRGALQSAFVGYGGVAAHAGRGYMTEALELLVAHAFTALGLHRLEANVQPDNHPSLALIRRVGFQREGFSPRYLRIGGRWRDHERWALSEETWLERRRG
jgi:[ribosomal protein S5]-alanine N-acetyltransferase